MYFSKTRKKRHLNVGCKNFTFLENKKKSGCERRNESQNLSFRGKKYVGKRKAGNSNIFQYYSKPNNFHIHLVSEVKLDINLRSF